MRLLTVLCVLACGVVSRPAHAQATPQTVATNNWVQMKSGLAYQIIARGAGPAAAPGQRVTIHETLTLLDGKVLYSTRAPANKPVTFEIGASQVIPGVEEGVTGMHVGERRKLLVPPSLDGRTFDPSVMPPQAIRQYDIELLAILPSPRSAARASQSMSSLISPTVSLTAAPDCVGRMAASENRTTMIEAARLEPGNRMPLLPAGEPHSFTVSVVVDTVGRADVTTLKLPEGLDSRTVDGIQNALPKWRFSPARLGACPVKQVVRLTFSR